MELSRYPLGIQDFKKLRNQNCVYVDKSAAIFDLTRNYYVFLSRPRRFGKSLLSSTLKYYFRGERELFTGLAIEKLETEWVKYPVLHFDLSSTKNRDIAGIESEISEMLSSYEDEYEIVKRNDLTLGQRLSVLITTASAKVGKRTVVIVDEYDAPLLDALHKDRELEDIRRLMQEFFTPLKSRDADLRFVFITGITKFSQMSIFSSVNNIQNVSMLPKYSTICGISEDELYTVFSEDIKELAHKYKVTTDQIKQMLKDNYDGYHFAEDLKDVYNPFSILSAFSQMKIQLYWFASGTPTFLIKQMEHFNTNVTQLDGIYVDASAFDRPTEALTDANPLLYQSGYLTIKDYNLHTDAYTLGIPNKEVRVGLMDNLLQTYTNKTASENSTLTLQMYSSLSDGNMDELFRVLKSYLSGIPYIEANGELTRKESFYETILYVIFSMMNRYVQTQVKSARGRTDIVMETSSTIYVMELKIDSSARMALDQIDSKDYMLPYSAYGKSLVKCGVNFSSQTRTIEDWIVV